MNQREHLILLLANSHIRQNPKPEQLNKARSLRSIPFVLANFYWSQLHDFWLSCFGLVQLNDLAVDEVMNKIFKNYKQWCKFMGRRHSLR